MSIFKVPVGVLKCMESIHKNFSMGFKDRIGKWSGFVGIKFLLRRKRAVLECLDSLL